MHCNNWCVTWQQTTSQDLGYLVKILWLCTDVLHVGESDVVPGDNKNPSWLEVVETFWWQRLLNDATGHRQQRSVCQSSNKEQHCQWPNDLDSVSCLERRLHLITAAVQRQRHRTTVNRITFTMETTKNKLVFFIIHQSVKKTSTLAADVA